MGVLLSSCHPQISSNSAIILCSADEPLARQAWLVWGCTTALPPSSYLARADLLPPRPYFISNRRASRIAIYWAAFYHVAHFWICGGEWLVILQFAIVGAAAGDSHIVQTPSWNAVIRPFWCEVGFTSAAGQSGVTQAEVFKGAGAVYELKTATRR